VSGTVEIPWLACAAEALASLAGRSAPKKMLVDLARLEKEYFDCHPDLGDPSDLVIFRTSAHRGSPSYGTFTEAHILVIMSPQLVLRKSAELPPELPCYNMAT
jgi:hypothetical protein